MFDHAADTHFKLSSHRLSHRQMKQDNVLNFLPSNYCNSSYISDIEIPLADNSVCLN